MKHSATPKRTGFTLIELMVAMTLTLFVMLILTQAFVTSLDTFDGLKGLGDMEAHLRTVATSLRTDLAQNHFEAKRRLSDPDCWTVPHKQGFFHIRQHGPSLSEGNDTDGIPSFATSKSGLHVLMFTNRLAGNQREKVYSATVPATSPLLDPTKKTNFFAHPADALWQEGTDRFNSQWATIAYFLVQTGSTDEFDNPNAATGTPLYALYRAEYLLVPNTAEVNTPPSAGTVAEYANVSIRDPAATAGNVVFNSPADVILEANRELDTAARVVPVRRGDPGTLPSPPLGSTLLMTNVVAFNVRVQRHFQTPYNQLEPDFSDLHLNPSGQRVFDTGNPLLQDVPRTDPVFAASPPLTDVRYRIHALEITIRIWDQKTEQARQITVIQSL